LQPGAGSEVQGLRIALQLNGAQAQLKRQEKQLEQKMQLLKHSEFFRSGFVGMNVSNPF